MKATLNVGSIHLKVRGVPPATATAAVHGLGPALARELRDGPNLRDDRAAPSVRVSPAVGAPALRRALAARLAQTLRPHLPAHP